MCICDNSVKVITRLVVQAEYLEIGFTIGAVAV